MTTRPSWWRNRPQRRLQTGANAEESRPGDNGSTHYTNTEKKRLNHHKGEAACEIISGEHSQACEQSLQEAFALEKMTSVNVLFITHFINQRLCL